MFKIPDRPDQLVTIKVIGVGGAGCNAVDFMIEKRLAGVDYIAANTDGQALKVSKADEKIHLGQKSSRGLGAGSDPEKGRFAAEESKDDIKNIIEGTDILFITAGMGGGTGTGASPVIAHVAKEMGVLTVAVVTTPFEMEMNNKMERALKGIERLRKEVDSIIIISNEKLMGETEDYTVEEAFKHADSILYKAVKGIVDLIVYPGKINIDFADIKKALKEGGDALICMGAAKGEERAAQAVMEAVNNPLLENTFISQSKHILINITSSGGLKMSEIKSAVKAITDMLNYEDIELKYGITNAPLEDKEIIMVTIIATGLNRKADYIVSKNVIAGAPTVVNRGDNLSGPTIFRNNIMS